VKGISHLRRLAGFVVGVELRLQLLHLQRKVNNIDTYHNKPAYCCDHAASQQRRHLSHNTIGRFAAALL
jgi:hypothetical protein